MIGGREEIEEAAALAKTFDTPEMQEVPYSELYNDVNKLSRALLSLKAENARLEAEMDEARDIGKRVADVDAALDRAADAESRLSALTSENEGLREALEEAIGLMPHDRRRQAAVARWRAALALSERKRN